MSAADRVTARPVTVRPATAADLNDVVGVFLACWRTSYAAVLPRRLVEVMTDGLARDLWARALKPPRRRVLRALVAG